MVSRDSSRRGSLLISLFEPDKGQFHRSSGLDKRNWIMRLWFGEVRPSLVRLRKSRRELEISHFVCKTKLTSENDSLVLGGRLVVGG